MQILSSRQLWKLVVWRLPWPLEGAQLDAQQAVLRRRGSCKLPSSCQHSTVIRGEGLPPRPGRLFSTTAVMVKLLESCSPQLSLSETTADQPLPACR